MAEAAPGAGKVQVDALARVLELTPRRVQQLAKEGVFPKAERGWYPLVPCIQAYIRYWQQRATAPDRESGSRTALLEAKTRMARASADRQELEVQEMLAALIPAPVHFEVLEQVMVAISNQVKSRPARWRPALEDKAGAVLLAALEELGQEELGLLRDAVLTIEAYKPPDGAVEPAPAAPLEPAE